MNHNTFPNGRSESSHGCLSYFSSNFQHIDPPRLSEKDYDKKMKLSVVAEFNRAQSAIGHHTMGASTFKRHLQKLFLRVGICPHKEDYYDTCRSNEIQLKHSSYILHKTKRSIICKMTERCRQDWEAALKDESARHQFTLVLSADYQQAKLTPYWGQSPQPGSTYYLMKHSTDVFSIVDHHNDSGHTFLFSKQFGPKNTDHTVSFLVKYIKSVQDAYPWIERMLLFLDNATSTNKNKYLISWAMEMAEQEMVSSLHICFLVAGHTKFTPNRYFASKTYNKSDVFNEGELGKLYSQHSQVNVSNGDDIYPWRDAMKALYSDIPGIRKFHNSSLFEWGINCHPE